MIIDLNLDVGFDLRSVIQLLLCLKSTVFTVIFQGVLSVIVGVPTEILRNICSWSVDSALKATARIVLLIFQCLILIDDIVSDGDILALNHMNDNFALFHKLQVFRWSLFDKWTKFATLNENFVEDD